MTSVRVAVSTKEIPQSLSSRFFKWFIPFSIKDQTLFWILISPVFLLFTIGLSYLIDSEKSSFFCFISVVAVALSIRWKEKGLIGALGWMGFWALAFSFQSSFSLSLWGIFLSLGIDCFLACYCVIEVEALIVHLESGSKKWQIHVQEQMINHEQEKETWEGEKKQLEEELKKWKEEASQRRIEKQAVDKKMDLMEKEIHYLSGQKEDFISEAREARLLAQERLQRLDRHLEQMKEISTLTQAWHEEKIRLQGEVEAKQEELSNQVQKLKSIQLEREEALKALEELKTKWEAFEYSSHQLKLDLHTWKEKAEQMQATLQAAREEKEEERKKWSAIDEENLLLKTKINNHEFSSEEVSKLNEELAALRREKAKAEGLYNQLKEQFSEKTSVLNKCRAELFHLQGKWEAQEKEKAIYSLNSEKDFEVQSMGYLFHELQKMAEANDLLEAEINDLEELISRFLNP